MTVSLDRVRLVTGTPPASPGVCVVCGNPGHKESQFIDFGFDIDFYGVVYFCAHCILQCLTVLKYVPIEELEKVVTEKIEAQFQLDAIKAQNQELQDAISAMRRVGFTTPIVDIEQSDVVVPVSEESEATEPTSRKAVGSKSRSTKQTNESGSSSVRNNDSIEEFKL